MNPYPPPPPPPPDPTAAAPGPAPAGQGLVELVRGQRQAVAYVFLGLSVLLLGVAIWLGFQGTRTAKADQPDTKLDAPDLPKPEVTDPKGRTYLLGAVAAAAGFLITAGVGVYLTARPPRPTPAGQRTEAREVILAGGGLLGAGLIVFGLAFFYWWSDDLLKGLEPVDWKLLRWPLGALLAVILGAGLVLAAAQPARAEERNNLLLRRLVYGSNFGVLVLLLLVVLVVGNVIAAKKVPDKLDTTATGFYTLSAGTKAFLGKLPEPVTLYLIAPHSEEREVNDLREFARSAQEASDGKLTAKFVSPVTNKAELTRLQEKYPRLGRDARDAYGVLLTTGADEKRSIFIPFNDLFETDPMTNQIKGFAGESKVMRELRFLADNERKPVVYFTQANGELSIDPTGAAGAVVGGSANQLKAFLEKNYVDVKPLVFPLKDPKVPDDAAVVVVAEPQTPLAPAAVDALRAYMTARKGKLIVLAGAVSGPDGRGMTKTGLEGLLGEFNVRLGEKFVYAAPTREIQDHRFVVTVFNPNLQNPVAQTMSQQVQAILLQLPREVAPAPGGNPQFQASPLMFTIPGRYTWTEDDRLDPGAVDQVLTDLENNEAVRTRKGLTRNPRPLAVVVSESTPPSPHGGPSPGGAGRLMVVGNAAIFSDRATERTRGTPVTFDLMAVAIDWLRDRPPLPTTGENKTYIEYKPPEPAAVDTTRLIYLPLGFGLLLITGLGAGVWVIRRK